MESNRKRKGFMKGKLGMKSFYRSATTSKPPSSSSSTPQSYNTSKVVVKPSPLIPPAASSMDYNNIANKLQDHHHLTHLMNNSQPNKERILPSTTASVNVHQQLDQQYANQRPVVASPSNNASVELTVNQEKVTPHPPKQKVSILLQESGSSLDSCANVVGGLYSALAADEGVDIKADTYISSVRERFRLQPLNS